jgi:hypothetical protein
MIEAHFCLFRYGMMVEAPIAGKTTNDELKCKKPAKMSSEHTRNNSCHILDL